MVGAQEQLLSAVMAVQPNCILVLVHGGPIAVESAVSSPAVRAIIDAFQPGELGADALLDLIEGKTTGPSGLMPYTTYLANYTHRDIREVDMRAGAGTTYWWHTEPVLFPFAFGMSYSNFTFEWQGPAAPSAGTASAAGTAAREVILPPPGDADALESFSVSHTVVVTNTGTRTSDLVVTALIAADPGGGSPADTPLKRLFGFERFAAVKPGEKRTAFFESDARALGVVGAEGSRWLHPGSYRVEIGGSGVQAGVAAAAQELRLVGTAPLLVEANEWVAKTTRSRPAAGL